MRPAPHLSARRRASLTLSGALCVAVCAASAPALAGPPTVGPPTVKEAKRFVRDVDANVRRLWVAQNRAEWEKQTNITPETEQRAAETGAEAMTWITAAIKKARRFEALGDRLPEPVARQLALLRLAGQPAPDDPDKAKELAALMTGMDAEYGKAKACNAAGECRDLEALSEVLTESQDPAELLDAWQAWHGAIGPTLRPLYPRFVALANEGARAIGFADAGEMWRSGYDMSPDEFEATLEGLWQEVKPLYAALHCYARRRLHEQYGEAVVPATGPVPAHLFGNMWAQDWTALSARIEPAPGAAQTDTTSALVAQQYDAVRMVKLAERFFTSLGMDPLPKTFWERSMLVKPEGREVVCHASAWDVDINNDLRIKMCIQPNHSDLITIHHELGHDYYFNHYYKEPVLFQQGANDGFHEAIGDTLALSVTPSYLRSVGLLTDPAEAPAPGDGDAHVSGADLNQLMYMATDKVAFLPWGLLVDKWRWDVFAGRVKPEDYTRHWWDLRREYQGVVPPNDRNDPALFDPGAKYHVASNTPYARYFLATILQFQFHRALCKAKGHTGPLYTCSIYGSKAAGKPFRDMLRLGAKRPWQDALAVVTGGERRMDASALLDYFAPLKAWLDQQNAGQTCGW